MVETTKTEDRRRHSADRIEFFGTKLVRVSGNTSDQRFNYESIDGKKTVSIEFLGERENLTFGSVEANDRRKGVEVAFSAIIENPTDVRTKNYIVEVDRAKIKGIEFTFLFRFEGTFVKTNFATVEIGDVNSLRREIRGEIVDTVNALCDAKRNPYLEEAKNALRHAYLRHSDAIRESRANASQAKEPEALIQTQRE
jgi:hypothetical protein